MERRFLMKIRDMAHSKPHSHAAKSEETMEDLHGKWALITGASSGFGEEFARQYAAQGRPLVLVARRLEKLETLAAELRETNRVEVIVEQVDLSNVAAVIQLHQRLRERGIAIDILINNAGHGLQGTFVDGTLDAALAMLQLDVVSLTAVTHMFAQDMRTRGRGKILLVASLLAYQGVEKFAVYAAAKAYVLRLGEALHRELKRDGVTVTVLCPGVSDTGGIVGGEVYGGPSDSTFGLLKHASS